MLLKFWGIEILVFIKFQTNSNIHYIFLHLQSGKVSAYAGILRQVIAFCYENILCLNTLYYKKGK